MSGIKERYNSNNPEMKLEPENGWYRMFPADENSETALTLGICYSESQSSWGYWDYNELTGKKEWVTIEVPQNDPELVKRKIPYTEEEQKHADEVAAALKPVFEELKKIFPGNHK